MLESSPGVIYLAGSYAARAQLCDVAQDWMEKGFIVISNWLWWEPQGDDQTHIERTIDLLDRGGIELASVVVIYHTVPSTKGGFHVELGLALGLEKPIICVGPKDQNPNGFYSNAKIRHVETTYEAIQLCLAGGWYVVA